MKIKRHSKIIEIIKNNSVETQDELSDHLRLEGFNVTQATVSRDIRELNLTKTTDENGALKYTQPTNDARDFNERFFRIFCDSVISMDYAANMIVIKTYEGCAMAAASCVDAMGFSAVLGCIAGDDTIFCAVKSEDDAVKIIEKLRSVIKL